MAAGAEGGADGEVIGGGKGGGMLNAVWEGWSGVCAGAHGVWLAVLERFIFSKVLSLKHSRHMSKGPNMRYI